MCHVVVVSFGIMQTIDYPLKALCQLMVRLDEGGHVIGCCKYLHIICFVCLLYFQMAIPEKISYHKEATHMYDIKFSEFKNLWNAITQPNKM